MIGGYFLCLDGYLTKKLMLLRQINAETIKIKVFRRLVWGWVFVIISWVCWSDVIFYPIACKRRIYKNGRPR